jgi:hypothetical protein
MLNLFDVPTSIIFHVPSPKTANIGMKFYRIPGCEVLEFPVFQKESNISTIFALLYPFKEKEGMNSAMIYCKNFGNVTMYPQ